MTTPAQPRHARAEIRSFAKELRAGGWTYERNDSKGHTLWSHPKASGLFKLAETPSRFRVQLARRDVLALLGEKPAGKRRPKPRPKPTARPAPVAAAKPAPARRVTRRLPWEDQPDDYDRGLARLMSTPPGGR